MSARPSGRVIVLGSCLAEAWAGHTTSHSHECEFYLSNNVAQLPEAPKHEIPEYDYQVIQIALASVLPKNALWRVRASSEYEAVFKYSCDSIDAMLNQLLRWNHSGDLLTFVSNFLVPQRNILGMLLPRYDLNSPAYFVEKLNEYLNERVLDERNVSFWTPTRLQRPLANDMCRTTQFYSSRTRG